MSVVVALKNIILHTLVDEFSYLVCAVLCARAENLPAPPPPPGGAAAMPPPSAGGGAASGVGAAGAAPVAAVVLA